MGTAALIKEFISKKYLSGDDLRFNEETSFLESELLDFTQMQELIAFLENAYGIAVEFEEMTPDNLDSVSKIAQFVARKLDSTTRPECMPA